jgi:hypothetical protein
MEFNKNNGKESWSHSTRLDRDNGKAIRRTILTQLERKICTKFYFLYCKTQRKGQAKANLCIVKAPQKTHPNSQLPNLPEKVARRSESFVAVSTLWANSCYKDPSEAAKTRAKGESLSDVVRNRPERSEETRSCHRKFTSKVQSEGSNCSTQKKNNVAVTCQEFMRTMTVNSCKDQQA